MTRKRGRVAGVVVALLAAAACGRQGERSPAAPPAEARDETQASPPLAPVPSHTRTIPDREAAPERDAMADRTIAGEMHWTVPKEWVQVTPSSPMRRAQYRLPAAPSDREDGECVVYYFGAGQGGDIQSNLQRWVAQFSGPGSQSPRLSEIDTGGLTISRVEVGGTYTPSPMSMTGDSTPEPKPGYMLLGAIVPGPEANWFFKCAGPETTMKANRETFDALVRSIHLAR